MIGCDRPPEALCTPHEDQLSPSAIQLLLATLLAEQPDLVLREVADVGDAAAPGEASGGVEDADADTNAETDTNAEVVIARL